MTNRQLRFFNVAREVSYMSDFKRARVGAVVVDGNRIISSGHNSQKTSTLQDKYNKYRQAPTSPTHRFMYIENSKMEVLVARDRVLHVSNLYTKWASKISTIPIGMVVS